MIKMTMMMKRAMKTMNVMKRQIITTSLVLMMIMMMILMMMMTILMVILMTMLMIMMMMMMILMMTNLWFTTFNEMRWGALNLRQGHAPTCIQ